MFSKSLIAAGSAAGAGLVLAKTQGSPLLTRTSGSNARANSAGGDNYDVMYYVKSALAGE